MYNFEEIYALYAKDVYKFLLKMSGNYSLAEELTQETFYKALKNIDKFKGTCKMSVWLCQIAKNEYLNYKKKRENKNIPLLHEDLESDSNDFEKIFKDDEAKYIYKALHKLDEPYKEVFTLRVFAQLPFKDIADINSKSDNWARVTYFRAKEQIIRILKEDMNYEL